MMVKFQTIFLFGLLLTCFTLSQARRNRTGHHENKPDEEQDPNQFLDQILEQLSNGIHQKSPIELPNFEHRFLQLGSLNMNNVRLLEVRNISRNSNSSIRGNEQEGVLTINSSLSVQGIKVASNSKVKVTLVKKTLKFEVSIRQLDFTISANYNVKENTLAINEFNLDKLSGVKVNVKGLGPFNPIFEKLTTITAHILEKFITKSMGRSIKKLTKEKVFNLPKQ